jgi:Fe-S cluster assembly scaffold protein SufB
MIIKVPENMKRNHSYNLDSDNVSIHVGSGADVVIHEDVNFNGNVKFSLTAGNNCKIIFISTNKSKNNENLRITRNFMLGDNTKVTAIYAKTGSKAIHEHRKTELFGIGSECIEHEVFFGNQNQQFSVVSDMINIGEDSVGEVHMHGVLDDKSFASCIGNMQVPKGAVGASSDLTQHILLLTDDAKAETYPYLEIEENNVKMAAHGATIQPLNEDHLFYLSSRGLSKEEARKTLVVGFLMPFFDNLKSDQRKLLLDMINEKWEEANVTARN